MLIKREKQNRAMVSGNGMHKHTDRMKLDNQQNVLNTESY